MQPRTAELLPGLRGGSESLLHHFKPFLGDTPDSMVKKYVRASGSRE